MGMRVRSADAEGWRSGSVGGGLGGWCGGADGAGSARSASRTGRAGSAGGRGERDCGSASCCGDPANWGGDSSESSGRASDGGDSADGMEQLELLCRQGDGQGHSRHGGPAGVDRDARRGLCVCEHRRHMGGRARREWEDPEQREVSRHEGAGGLCPLQGAEAGDLFFAGGEDVRAVRGQPGPRGAGRGRRTRSGESII